MKDTETSVAAPELLSGLVTRSALFGLLPPDGLGRLAEEKTEWLLVCASAAIGLSSLLPSYLRQHRRALPLATFAGGMASIIAGRVLFDAGADVEAASRPPVRTK